ncbi:LysM peptidoglycan-binding domain-containing protein [Mesobacillus maritimus]|uniref:LysM peptidoglycan-binding domain-containing protein n=1 Tax=Mesobacillus maritimus TaxID=1643336 RepID=UPI003850A53E
MQFFYTVRQGDTVSQIAKRWELPVESLIAANNLAPPYTLYVGQQLSVPIGIDVINVKAGDTVYKIAQAYGVPPSVIIQANQLQPICITNRTAFNCSSWYPLLCRPTRGYLISNR